MLYVFFTARDRYFFPHNVRAVRLRTTLFWKGTLMMVINHDAARKPTWRPCPPSLWWRHYRQRQAVITVTTVSSYPVLGTGAFCDWWTDGRMWPWYCSESLYSGNAPRYVMSHETDGSPTVT